MQALPAASASDVAFAIPARELVPGAYLLDIEASTEKHMQILRELRFAIR